MTLSSLCELAYTNMTHRTHLKLEYLLCSGVFEVLGWDVISHQLKVRRQLVRVESTNLDVRLDETTLFQIPQWTKMNSA